MLCKHTHSSQERHESCAVSFETRSIAIKAFGGTVLVVGHPGNMGHDQPVQLLFCKITIAATGNNEFKTFFERFPTASSRRIRGAAGNGPQQYNRQQNAEFITPRYLGSYASEGYI